MASAPAGDGREVVCTENNSGTLVLSNPGEADAPSPAVLGRYHAQVLDAARRYRVAPALLAAVMQVESAGRPQAVSPKGARGLMQLMPATASAYGVSDAFDPVQSLQAGAQHLRALLDRFGGDLALTAAAYNAGAGAVQRHHGQVPPFRETQAYVRQVLARHAALQALAGVEPP